MDGADQHELNDVTNSQAFCIRGCATSCFKRCITKSRIFLSIRRRRRGKGRTSATQMNQRDQDLTSRNTVCKISLSLLLQNAYKNVPVLKNDDLNNVVTDEGRLK